MKIQNINQQQYNNKKYDNSTFTGAPDLFLRFLDTNQAWGANAVDLASMVIPRTTVDFVNRGPAAGMETGRREASGTINHSLVGVYGTIAGLALAAALNNRYGIKAHKLFVDDETLDILAKAWDKQVRAGNQNPVNDYLRDVFGNAQTRVGDEWRKIPDDKLNDVVNKFESVLKSNDAPVTISKDLKAYAQSVITHATGSENSFKLAEIQIFKELTKKNPLLLLDDIFSEIDIKKRNRLLKYIDGSIQTIITTTDLKNINKKIVENAKIFKVIDGTVTEKVGK